MTFEIKFYKKSNKNPIMDFILALDDEELQLTIFAVFKRLELDPFSLGSMSKKIEGVRNLFELRIRGKNKNVRIFYCFEKNRIIILLNGFVKKSQEIPSKELE